MIKTLRAEFNVTGLLRFLSHRQAMKMFQRVFARAELDIAFSQGFNPRPKMSLPLPRAVGIETLNDVLVVQVNQPDDFDGEIDYFRLLAEQLPDGCELKSLEIGEAKIKPVVESAVYTFCVKDPHIESVFDSAGKLKEALEAGEQVLIERESKKGNVKKVDASALIIDVSFGADKVVFKSSISQSGSLRVDELANLVNLNRSMINGPVVRSNVEWKK